MGDVVICAEGLGKKYLIGHRSAERERYTALRDVATRSLKALGSSAINMIRGRQIVPGDEVEEFWALKEISFEINRGEVVGIIGRNGAGKSTLLKVLSRITEPSTGRVSIRGRLASLLEVGTGFHPELSGRENIYLNGAILGLSRSEITRKFDEIVYFAEVERFLDTPVKRYSSGMYVRLAFAVAAHLEPEILVVDEVLAVGDAEFQKKCLGKMHDVAGAGRTVLFVSHNLAMIRSLCQSTILLENGTIRAHGSTSDVFLAYSSSDGQSAAAVNFASKGVRIGNEYARLLSACIRNEFGQLVAEVEIDRPFTVEMTYCLYQDDGRAYVPNFHFFTADGRCAFVTSAVNAAPLKSGNYSSRCHVPPNLLNEGLYSIRLALTSFEDGVDVHFNQVGALTFNVYDRVDDVPTRGNYTGSFPGAVRPHLPWTIEPIH